jgi:hypothetical protein
MKAILTRTKSNHLQTNGVLGLFNEENVCIFSCVTLERGDLDNEKMKSCIPVGTYKVVPRYSAKFGHHLHVTNVMNRDFILIHPANYWKQLNGCIAVGRYLKDIDGDSFKDTCESKTTMTILLALAPNGFELQIENIEEV